MTTPTTATPASPAAVAQSAAQAQAYIASTRRSKVTDYVPATSHDGVAAAGKCEWTGHAAGALTDDEVAALAWLLIQEIMRVRCGRATSVYDIWHRHTLAGTTIAAANDLEVVASFVASVFGRPSSPKSETHLEGHMGEWLWHLLTKDPPAVRHQPDPKGDVTDAGGDGYTIYEDATGSLRFRLWESKKNTGDQRLSGSLWEAYQQLKTEGQRYVAKIVTAHGHGPLVGQNDIDTLIGQLPAAWVQGDDLVGAGVTLATHQNLPGAPFKRMAGHLPLLDKPGQLRGLATSIGRYAEVALTVRKYAWTAL